MTPIGNIDGLVLLLRQRLLERSQTGGARQAGVRSRADSSLNAVQALAAVDDIDDRQLKRALIQNLLAEHFGSKMINEAGFQQVVDRVTDTIEADAGGALLLSKLARELRASAG